LRRISFDFEIEAEVKVEVKVKVEVFHAKAQSTERRKGYKIWNAELLATLCAFAPLREIP